MEKMHRARFGERVCALQDLYEHATLPKSPHGHQPGSSPNPALGFLWWLHYISVID